MKRRELIRHLEENGCRQLREGGRHTIYVNPGQKKVSVESSWNVLGKNGVTCERVPEQAKPKPGGADPAPGSAAFVSEKGGRPGGAVCACTVKSNRW